MTNLRDNKFIKMNRHLKSSQVCEKLELLSEIPTNNTTGFQVDTPWRDEIVGTNVFAPLDLTQDNPDDSGRDTTGLFGEDSSILTVEPPGDTSYVLGPMMSMWYSWGNFSMIGYVRESDRRMVNLARITGTIQSWDGTSNFTSYGQLTLEQAQWYKSQVDAGDVSDYRAFYPGPPSNPADQWGRYLGLIVNLPKQLQAQILGRIGGLMRGWNPDDIIQPPGFFGDIAKGIDGLMKNIKPFTDLLLGVDDSAILDVLKATNDNVILPIFQKIGQAATQSFGIQSGLIMTAALDIRGTVHTARLGGENEIFMRGGDFPVMIKSNNELDYVANLASSLMKSIGTGRMIMIDNSNLSSSIVGSRLTSNDIKTAFSTHKVQTNGSPKPLSTDADSILNPTNKKTYFGGKGFGTEGGSILEPYISKDGTPMLRNTADKFLRMGGESGERYDITTQQFTDIPSPTSADAKKFVDLAANRGLYEIVKRQSGNENLTYDQYQSTINNNADLKSTINNTISVGKDVLDLPYTAKGIGWTTGFANGSAIGSLIYAEVKKVFGGRPVTELDSKGGRGHVRRETHISINDLQPEQQRVFIQQLDAQGINYNKNWSSVKESREVLTESRKRILRDIKKPYKLPETPKQKYTIKPKVLGSNRTINSELMKKAEVPTSFVKPEEKLWGKYEKNKNARMSQERKNEVLDHLGGSDHAWEWLTETNKVKNKNIMYGNFDIEKNMGIESEKVKNHIVRKEELNGDYLLFLVDEHGKKEKMLQSEFNEKLADEFDKEVFGKYLSEQETLDAPKDPLFAKVKNRLRQVIDYEDKPSKLGYPDQPPPEMVNGYHPEYGNRSNYYNTLDPQSAETMPSTGNPEIDAKVQKAKRLKKILGKGG